MAARYKNAVDIRAQEYAQRLIGQGFSGRVAVIYARKRFGRGCLK